MAQPNVTLRFAALSTRPSEAPWSPTPSGEGMTSSIVLTGGTGALGRLVLPLLHDAGCQVRVLSRR
jgi:hypothetical protein